MFDWELEARVPFIWNMSPLEIPTLVFLSLTHPSHPHECTIVPMKVLRKAILTYISKLMLWKYHHQLRECDCWKEIWGVKANYYIWNLSFYQTQKVFRWHIVGKGFSMTYCGQLFPPFYWSIFVEVFIFKQKLLQTMLQILILWK